MTDKFIDRVKRSHELRTGQEWGTDDTVSTFRLYSVEKRVEALEQVREAKAQADTSSMRDYARLCRLETDLEAEHRTLLDAQR